MLYICVENFYRHVQTLPRLTHEQEADCARKAAQGDTAAREQRIQQYLPLVAALVRKAPPRIQTLHTVYSLIAVVEKQVDTFDVNQPHEAFLRHLNWALRQCLTRCITEHG